MSLSDGGDDRTYVRDRSAPIADSNAATDAGPRAAGAQVGRYVVLERIASGGMGEVYAAWDPQLDRKVALKLVRADVVEQMGESQGRSRLLREAQAMAKLAHPNIVTVHDAGQVGNEVFVAMEFLDGSSLREYLAEHKPTWRETLRIFLEAGRGLAAAHEAGLVHRDFKPHNVLVTRSGRICVLDFGLARAAAAPLADEPREHAGHHGTVDGNISVDSTLTAAGSVMGTPGYMSPEQYRGDVTSPATDQYSFCIALYEGLYGKRPFSAGTLDGLRAEAEAGIGDAPRGAKVPRALFRVLKRGLAPKAGERYPSMAELLRALNRIYLFRTGKRGYAWLAAGLALIAFASAWATKGVITNPCPSAQPRFDEIWNDRIGNEVRAAFAASGVSSADTAFSEADRLLRAWGSDWVSMQKDACEATNVRHEQSPELLDRRIACLSRRLDETRGLVSILKAADARVVIHSVEAAAALKPLQSCANATVLMSSARTPPPELIPTLDQVRPKIAQAITLTQAGREDDAKRVLLSLATVVDDSGWEPLKAEYALACAQLHYARFEASDVVDRAHLAAKSALFAGDTEQLVSAWTLLSLVYSRLRQLEDAQRWADYAQAQLSQVGENTALAAEVEDAQYNMFLQRGDYAEAIKRAAKAKELFEKAYGPEHPRVAIMYDEIGWAQSWMGDQDAAVENERRAAEMIHRKFGDEHPLMARVLNHLASVEEERDELDSALEHHLTALALREKLYGPDHTEVGASCNNLALLYVRMNRPDDAARTAERAVAIERRLVPGTARFAGTLDTLAQARLAQGRFAEAISLWEETIELADRNGNTNKLDRSLYLTGLGEAQLRLGHTAEAVQSLEAAALLVKDESLASYVGKTYAVLAEAYLAAGKRKSAEDAAELARSSFASAGKKGETLRAALDKVLPPKEQAKDAP